MARLDERDLAHVMDHARLEWSDLRAARVLLTGATGFVGSWLLETLVHASDALDLGVHVTVLAREPHAFGARFPRLAASDCVHVQAGDVRSADLRGIAPSHLVHCASAATPRVNAEEPGQVVDLIERGTANMLAVAERSRGARFLQVSSGSVYGPQPASLTRLDEGFAGGANPDDSAQRFGAAKRRAEQRGEASVARGVGFVSARLFALIGPRLPLDGTFAIGNFLGDAIAGRPIRLTGDGTPLRSWMHAADMAAWCWTLLVRGRAGVAYNVGSEETLSIWDAASRVALLTDPPVMVARSRSGDPAALPGRYVPSTRRARDELGLECRIPFDAALRRTWDWLQTEDA